MDTIAAVVALVLAFGNLTTNRNLVERQLQAFDHELVGLIH
jgi:hypothetical protein